MKWHSDSAIFIHSMSLGVRVVMSCQSVHWLCSVYFCCQHSRGVTSCHLGGGRGGAGLRGCNLDISFLFSHLLIIVSYYFKDECISLSFIVSFSILWYWPTTFLSQDSHAHETYDVLLVLFQLVIGGWCSYTPSQIITSFLFFLMYRYN